MGRITTGVGLVSGLGYQDIVDSLIAIEKRPVDQLTSQLTTRKNQQAAYTALSASLLSLSLNVSRFGQSSVLNARQASSSNSAVLQAAVDASAGVGTYSFRPVQLAQTQRFTSAGFNDATTQAVGAGTISIKRGGFVTTDLALDALNGGSGVARGRIRITDRSGASAVVDLTSARTVGDVLDAVNDNGAVAVTASLQGDTIVLADQSGQTAANLTVQEVGGGTTAASLGLLGSVAASQLVGSDVVKLGSDLKLSYLNDGLGVRRHGSSNDLRINLKDGSTVDVNLAAATTIQEVLAAINSDSENGGKVTASIAAGGDKLVLTDVTGGGGTLSVTALNGSKAAQDLGLLGSEQGGGVLTGSRVLAGLNSVLLKNLRGAQGIATPGQVQLTDRSGATATVDLTNAASLSDVIGAINSAGLGITASVNAAGHGITLSDTTGSSTSNLIVADVGGGTTAANLNIAGSVAATKIESGDLHRAYVNEATLLSSLNGGVGVSAGQFSITDKAGNATVLNVSNGSYKTLGDLILAVNAGSAQVTASINSTGDGILLTDVSGGSGSLKVEDLAGGKTAAGLRLKGTASASIDGAFVDTVTIDADDTLNDVVTKLTPSGALVTASVFNTGGPQGYHLLVASSQSGAAGRLLIDSGSTGLNFTQSQRAQDAVVQLTGVGASPLFFTSSSNSFKSIIGGVSLDVQGTSTTPITVSVASDSSALVSAVNDFVKGFNSLTSSLAKQTSFDPATTTSAILQGDQTAVGLHNALLGIIGRRYGSGTSSQVRSFADLGITLSGGQLSLDENKLRNAASVDPEGVKDFLGAKDVGASAVVSRIIKSYSNASSGILFNKIDALDSDQKNLQARIDSMNGIIDARKSRLENQFAQLEKVLAQMQAQQSALSGLLASISNPSNSKTSK